MGIIKAIKNYFRHEMRRKFINILDDAPEAGLMAQTMVKQNTVFCWTPCV